MNVALVILHADPARGGAERYTVDLAHGLAGRGHRVTLVSSASADPAATGPYATVRLPAGGTTRDGRYRRFLDALDAHTAAAGYDVVHAMLPVRRCDVYHPHAGVAAEAARRGSAVTRWANRRRHRFAAVERDLLTGPRPPVVLCLSDVVRADVRQWYPGLADDRLATLFNAVDLTRFDPGREPDSRERTRAELGYRPGDVVALMIAQDFRRKGLAQAIGAVDECDPRLSLLVVGRDDPRRYRAWAVECAVVDRVRFAGPTADPVPFYRAADLFVLPTRHDPCSLVVLEALAMGLPVISTVRNGACEVMSDGVHGRVLPDPDDVPALAAAMAELLDDARRAEMAAACRALRPALSVDRHLGTLEAVYDRVADRRPPAA